MTIVFLQLFIVLSLSLFSIRWILPVLLKLKGMPDRRKKGYRPSVTALMSCFNEGEDVYHTLVSLANVNYPKGLLKVIAIDDCSTDESFKWMQKASSEYPIIQAIRNEKNRGKHRNILAGAEMSKSDIILATDSDLVYDPNVLIELVESFHKDSVGAVGGVVGIKNPQDNVMTQWQTMIYHYGFNLWKMPESRLSTVFCISGCLFAIRRKVFNEIKQKIADRNWFGIEVKGGEDRYMTHQVLMHGYDTIVNTAAKCYTTAPSTLKQLFMQQLRWKRSGLMMYFWALRRPLLHTKRFNVASLALLFFPPTLSLTVLGVYISAIISGEIGFTLINKFMFTIMIFVCVALVSMVVINKYDHRQKFIGALFLPALMFWYVIIDQFFLPLLAILTFDEKGWSSR
jgi:cellulose synthase/poly-beta-1,6-N-acetylglucosamine synthase-like glycosyltransferase